MVRDASGVGPRPPRLPGRLGPLLAVLLTAGAVWAMATVSPESAPEAPSIGPPETVATAAIPTDRLAADWRETLVIGAGAFGRVAAGPSALVVVGDPESGLDRTLMLFTSNGSDWEPVGDDAAFEGARINTVVAVGESFVAAGAILGSNRLEPAVWTAADGREWTRVILPPTSPAHQTVGDLVVTESGMLALGSAVSDLGIIGGTPKTPAVGHGLWDFDGVEWRSVAASTADGRPFLVDVLPAGDSFVGGGTLQGKARLWVSSDGESWGLVRGTGNRWPDRLAFTSMVQLSDGTVVAAATREGEQSVIFRSKDLLTWEKIDTANGPRQIARLIPVKGGLVAIPDPFGPSPALFWTSGDGEAWQPVLPGDSGLPVASDGVQAVVRDVVEWGCRDIAVGSLGLQPAIWSRGCGIDP